MKKKWLTKIATCILACTAIGYEHIKELNQLAAMRIQIPQIYNEINLLNEEIDQIAFQIQMIENPAHLLVMTKEAQFSDMKFPLNEDVFILACNTSNEITVKSEIIKPFEMHPFKLSVILGAH